MLTTEAEAKTRWCPEARVPLYTDGSRGGIVRIVAANRLEGDVPFSKCIGSGCMMWCWADPKAYDDLRQGYCGKAGRP